MEVQAYGDFLRGQGVAETEVQTRMAAIRSFLEKLMALGVALPDAGKDDFLRVAGRMIADGSNTIEAFDAAGEYLLWAGLRAQYIAVTEIKDCHNGMEKLAAGIEARHGAAVRGRIFVQLPPPLGADEAVRWAYTRSVTGRMAEQLTPAQRREAWFSVQHGIPEAYWNKRDLAERETCAGCQTVEEFLIKKQRERSAMLRCMHEQNVLWFTMELTDEVFAYITREPHMRMGEYKGRRGIVITKVPYQPEKMLRATDSRRKRYHACHCPLIREAILRGEPIPPEVCHCSLGHASHFLAGLGLNLEGEVMESVAQGDEHCRFIFYLPQDGMEEKDKS